MPELIDKDALRYIESDKDAYTGDWNDDYEKGFRDALNKALELPTIEPEVLLIPKEVSANDIDKLTEMIKGSLLQAYPNDVMFTAVRHGRTKMPELMTKKDAIEYLLYMKHDVQAKSPMDIALDTAIEALKQPTIEPKRGRWIQSDALDYKDPNGVIHVHGMCSCCRLIYDFRDMTSRFKFCPNCGARMDGGADNG